jgi:uncharacterized OB-fold protein
MATRVPLKEGLLSTVDDPQAARLLGGRCPMCTRVSFPAQDVCPYCSTDGCEAVPLSTTGTIEVCTTVINRPPGYEGPLPFGFGVVELPDGIRVLSRIMPAERGRPGVAAHLVLETLHTDTDGREIVTYAFRPVES